MLHLSPLVIAGGDPVHGALPAGVSHWFQGLLRRQRGHDRPSDAPDGGRVRAGVAGSRRRGGGGKRPEILVINVISFMISVTIITVIYNYDK